MNYSYNVINPCMFPLEFVTAVWFMMRDAMFNKKLRWRWQTRATRLEVSQGHQTYSTIPYVRYSFLLCNSNFVFKTRPFSDIRPPKSRDLEIRVIGHSRSMKVVPFDRLRMISY